MGSRRIYSREGIAAWEEYFELTSRSNREPPLPIIDSSGNYIEPELARGDSSASQTHIEQPEHVQLYTFVTNMTFQLPIHCTKLQYEPLPPGCIRLLKLPKAKDALSFPNGFELITVPVDDAPSYEALSYAWGELNMCTPLFFLTHNKQSVCRSAEYENQASTDAGVTAEEDTANVTTQEHNEEKDGHIEKENSEIIDANSPEDEENNDDAGSEPITDKIQSLRVTVELALVLLTLMKDDTSRLVWVDQICINQLDIDERNSQVRMMSKVYSKAEKVVIWLGEPEPIGEDQLECMPFDPPAEYEILPGFNLFNWVRAAGAFGRGWFSRMWICQEAILAKEIQIQYGDYRDDWDRAFKILQFGLISGRVPIEIVKYTQGGRNLATTVQNARRKIAEGVDLNMQDLVVATAKRQQCRDPKDKIFGIIGCDLKGIFPPDFVDYHKSVEEVYTESTKILIEYYGNLTMLAATRPTLSARKYSLPSWVPDWSLGYDTAPIDGIPSTYAASQGRSHISTPSSDPSHLIVKGKVIDKIAIVVQHNFESYDPMHDIYNFVSARRLLSELWAATNGLYEGGEDEYVTVCSDAKSDTPEVQYPMTFIRMFVHTILAVKEIATDIWGAFHEEPFMEFQPGGFLHDDWHYHAIIDTLTSGVDYDNDTEPPSTPLELPTAEIRHRWRSLCASLTLRCYLRRVAVLESGRLALVGAQAAVGDEIAILHGLATPCTLAQGDEGWVYKGDVFIHQMMEGVAVTWTVEEADAFVIV